MTVTLDWTVIAALLAWTVLVFWLGRRSAAAGSHDLLGVPSQMAPPRPGARPDMTPVAPSQGLSPGQLEAIRGALAAGNKIAAIKLYRKASGLGLAEAKAAVESMER
jgi:large subunit ribosomal protein L7/L12